MLKLIFKKCLKRNVKFQNISWANYKQKPRDLEIYLCICQSIIKISFYKTIFKISKNGQMNDIQRFKTHHLIPISACLKTVEKSTFPHDLCFLKSSIAGWVLIFSICSFNNVASYLLLYDFICAKKDLTVSMKYRASHIIPDYLQALTPKYSKNLEGNFYKNRVHF